MAAAVVLTVTPELYFKRNVYKHVVHSQTENLLSLTIVAAAHRRHGGSRADNQPQGPFAFS
jgi:hypothetical protein